jgi:hypothetical protein
MSEKKSVTREIKGEYRKAGKKDKAVMLDQFVKLTGYNRKYAIRLLSKKEDIQATVIANGKTAVFKPEKKARPKNRLGKPVCTRETVEALEKIWAFYGGKCGVYLSLFIKIHRKKLYPVNASGASVSRRKPGILFVFYVRLTAEKDLYIL